MMSRITAPVGDVTTPITPGRNGSGRLRSLANSPSASSRRRVFSSSASSAPSPAISIVSMTIWYFERPGKVVSLPEATTSIPSSGRKPSRCAPPRHITPSITAPSSLRQQ
jgi:hypothetical protein